MPNNQNTYNQPAMGEQEQMQQMGMPPQGAMMPPQGQMMPPPQMRPRGWRERWMRRMDVVAAPLRKGELTVPNWLTGKSMVFFFVATFAC